MFCFVYYIQLINCIPDVDIYSRHHFFWHILLVIQGWYWFVSTMSPLHLPYGHFPYHLVQLLHIVQILTPKGCSVCCYIITTLKRGFSLRIIQLRIIFLAFLFARFLLFCIFATVNQLIIWNYEKAFYFFNHDADGGIIVRSVQR